MLVRRPLELVLFALVVACGCGSSEAEDLGRGSASLDVTTPARELGIDDLIFQRVDSRPFVVCPPDSPFVCRAMNATGWTCSELACAPSCERIGCPGDFLCVDCGAGAECMPPHRACASHD